MTLLKENARMTKERGKNMYLDLTQCFTKKIPIIDFDQLMKRDEREKLYFSWNNTIYYAKRPNLNELIGEELAKEINIDTVYFEFFQNKNGEVWMASQDFRKENCNYYTPIEISSNLSENTFYLWKDICIDQENESKFLEHIFKMFAIDIYMKQQDRVSNIQIEKFDTGYIDLAPLYDYSNSSWNQFIGYANGLYTFSSLSDYQKMFGCYPQFLEILKQIQKKSMKKLLENIEETKEIIIPNSLKEIYLQREEISQKKLQKIIN